MLKRKIWRDLRQNLTQFMAIFLMSLLGLWIYGGMDAESTGATLVADRFYQEFNLSDLWVMGGGFSNEEVRKISELPGVVSAERRLMTSGELVLTSEADKSNTDAANTDATNADKNTDVANTNATNTDKNTDVVNTNATNTDKNTDAVNTDTTNTDVETLDKANNNEINKEIKNPPMQLGFLTSYETNLFDVREGEDFVPDTDGVWIDRFIAKKQNLAVGDTVQFKIDGQTIDAVIRGIIRTPEMVYYSDSTDMTAQYGDFGYAFMSASAFPTADSMIYNQIIIDTEEDDEKAQQPMKEAISQTLDRDNIVISDRSQTLAFSTFQSEMSMHKSMGILFSAVFLLIAVLGIVTTMTRLTSNQRTQIGTLKAVGFSKRVITRHYVSYGFILSLAGSIIGMYIGAATFPRIIYPAFEGGYELPPLTGHLSSGPYIAIVISVAISTFVSFLSCRKELADMPAVTLRPAAPKKIKHSAFEKSKMWLSMSFASQWNIRDMLRNKARTVMGILGVSGCTMLMLCAFGCKDSNYAMLEWMYGDVMTAEYKISLSERADYITALEYAEKYKGQLLQESSIEIYAKDERKTGTLTVLDTGNYMHYQDASLNKTLLDETGVTLSYKMAQNLGIQEGEFVKWHIIGEDEWETSRVAQIYREPMTQGITMYRKTYEAINHKFKPTSILTNMKVEDNLATEDENVHAVLNVSQMKADFEKNMEGMNMMISMMVTSAVILGIVVLYNLGVLSFVEKMREIATLKVLGFQTRKVRAILQTQNIIITMLGILLGLPFGNGLLYVLCSTISDDMDMIPKAGLQSCLISIGGTFLVSIAVNFILSGKVKTIDMVDALKGVE